jgi:hypothetical protein
MSGFGGGGVRDWDDVGSGDAGGAGGGGGGGGVTQFGCTMAKKLVHFLTISHRATAEVLTRTNLILLNSSCCHFQTISAKKLGLVT